MPKFKSPQAKKRAKEYKLSERQKELRLQPQEIRLEKYQRFAAEMQAKIEKLDIELKRLTDLLITRGEEKQAATWLHQYNTVSEKIARCRATQASAIETVAALLKEAADEKLFDDLNKLDIP